MSKQEADFANTQASVIRCLLDINSRSYDCARIWHLSPDVKCGDGNRWAGKIGSVYSCCPKGLQGGSISKSLRSKFLILFSCSPNFQETSLSLSLLSVRLHSIVLSFPCRLSAGVQENGNTAALRFLSILNRLFWFFFFLSSLLHIYPFKKKKKWRSTFVIVASNNPATDLVRGSWWSYWKSGQ